MKITLIILSVLALLAGCGQKVKKQPLTPIQTQETTETTTDSIKREQQEIAERVLHDSIRWAKEAQEELERCNACPKITDEQLATLKPIIRKWLNFYNLDFAQARLVKIDTFCFDCPPAPGSIHIRDFGEEEDTDKRIDVDYSPNKQRYVDLGMFYGYDEREDGKYNFQGWDDCQEIYFIDRKQKIQKMILWLGSSERADAVFWKSNDIFVIAGHNCGDRKNFVFTFDIKKQTRSYYYVASWKEDDSPDYMNRVYWKEKGIIVVD